MKKVMAIIAVAVLLLNVGYVVKSAHDFSEKENRMVSWLSAGIGGEAKIIDSIYGKEFVATYTIDSNYVIWRTVEWK